MAGPNESARIAALEAAVGELQAQLVAVRADRFSQEAADTFWLIISGIMIFFMQCGFGMLEAGAVSSRSTQSILMKNLVDASLAGLLWWLVGYGIMHEGGNAFFGIQPAIPNQTHTLYATHEFMQGGVQTSGSDWARVFFEFTYAANAGTVVSGAVAERAQLPAYLIFSSLITSFVYPVVAHWVRSMPSPRTSDGLWRPLMASDGL